MADVIKIKLLKAVQPLNAGEYCGFTQEVLDRLPVGSYELVETKKERAARLKKEKIASDAAFKAAEEAAEKDGGE